MEIIPEGKHFRLVHESELPEILVTLERFLPESLKVRMKNANTTLVFFFASLFPLKAVSPTWHQDIPQLPRPILSDNLPTITCSLGRKKGFFLFRRRCKFRDRDHKSCNPKPSKPGSHFFLLTCFHCLHLYFCSIFNAIPPRTSRAFVLLLAISMAWHRPQGFGHHWSFRFLARNFFPGRLPTALGMRCQLLEKAFIIV